MRSILLVCAWAGVAHADVPPAEVTADQAVALYREHNPRARAARAQTDVVAADIVDARTYPNPTLSVSTSATVHGVATSGDEQQAVEVDIPLLVHKRGKRTHAAEKRVEASKASVAADEADAAREVRRRWVALLAAQERVTALAETVKDTQHVRELVSGRAAAGAKSPYDLERTDLALATLESRLSDAKTDVLVASATLAEAVGVPDWHPHAVGELRPGPEPPAGGVSADHPSLVKPRTAAEQARAEEELAHAEATPTPSLVVAGYGTSGPFGIGLTLGVQWPLPIFDRNKGAIARARAGEHAAQLDAAATSFELSSQLTRARDVLSARRATLVAFEAGATERLPKIRTMAEDAYKSGQGGIVELLDALDAIDDTRLRDIDLIEAVLDAELEVRAALSGD